VEDLPFVIERLVSGRRQRAVRDRPDDRFSKALEKQRREPASLELAGNDANPGDAERARHASFHRAGGDGCQASGRSGAVFVCGEGSFLSCRLATWGFVPPIRRKRHAAHGQCRAGMPVVEAAGTDSV